ncbi:hypothetical protein I4U23_026552 [Adineta vaga]|nr:hypothetical protein I4U23_026552 [Adineta vaga]
MIVSSCQLLFIGMILIVFTVQINAGYWLCDWVNRRGWVYCQRGYCNSFGRKRSHDIDYSETSPIQNEDGVYCTNKKICFSCHSIKDDLCYLTPIENYSPPNHSTSNRKRATEACE